MYETVLFMQSTRRVPYIGLQGGGVPAGGTMHAGHAYWQSTITPVSAAPQLYPAPPQPSLYVTPFPRDLPSIVARPYKLLKGGGIKNGVKLEDGFAPVAVVGAPSLAELYADENMGRTDLATTEAASRRAMFRMRQDTETGGLQSMINDTEMASENNQARDQQPQMVRRTSDLNLGSSSTHEMNDVKYDYVRSNPEGLGNPWSMTQTPSGNLVAPQDDKNVSQQPTLLSEPTTVQVSKQPPVHAPKPDSALNHSDTFFNFTPTSINQKLNDALSFMMADPPTVAYDPSKSEDFAAFDSRRRNRYEF